MNPILLQIFNRPWYIDYNQAASFSYAVKALLDGKLVFEADKQTYEPKIVSQQATKSAATYTQNGVQRSRMVSVIPIQGPLMKKDQYCGPVGMDTIGRYIKNADNNPEIDAIILDIDSPGGTVSGTANLGKVIRDTKKPIIAFVNELAASAAYWIASQCDEIIASDQKAEVGSIGVMLTAIDVQPMWEKQGVVFHEIYANGSEEKNQDWKDIRKKKYDAFKKRSLDPLREYFEETVKAARGDKIKDVGVYKGRINFADKAVEIGLIDRIASFEETVDIALNLADQNNQPKATNTQKPISSMKKRPLLLAALGLESLEENDGGSFLNEAQLDALEAKLSAHQAELDAISAESVQAKASLTAAEEKAVQDLASKDAEIGTLNTKIEELESQVTSLKSGAGESSASASVKLNKDVELTDKNDPMLEELAKCKNAAERLIVIDKYKNQKTE